MFLAQVPAVVAPEDDDRAVTLGRLVQRVEQAADLRVGERDCGQVSLDGLLPRAGATILIVLVGLGHLDAGRGHVVQVVFAERRQLDLSSGCMS